MHEQYVKSGYVWEQYDDQIGVGKVRIICNVIHDYHTCSSGFYLICYCGCRNFCNVSDPL